MSGEVVLWRVVPGDVKQLNATTGAVVRSSEVLNQAGCLNLQIVLRRWYFEIAGARGAGGAAGAARSGAAKLVYLVRERARGFLHVKEAGRPRDDFVECRGTGSGYWARYSIKVNYEVESS